MYVLMLREIWKYKMTSDGMSKRQGFIGYSLENKQNFQPICTIFYEKCLNKWNLEQLYRKDIGNDINMLPNRPNVVKENEYVKLTFNKELKSL